jgi:antitoxin HigA-1
MVRAQFSHAFDHGDEFWIIRPISYGNRPAAQRSMLILDFKKFLGLGYFRENAAFNATMNKQQKENQMKKSKKILHGILPGKVLAKDFMKPRGLTPDQVAKETGVPVQHINEIVQGKRAITLEIALGLERYFGSSAQEWRDNLQTLNYLEWHEAALKMILADLKSAPRQLKWCRTLVKMQLRALLRSGG